MRVAVPFRLFERVVAELRERGDEILGEHLRHLSPLEWEHITLTGVYRWNLRDEQRPAAGHLRLLKKRSSAPV